MCLGTWGEWACSTTCGPGTASRSRSCASGVCGGVCSGASLVEERACGSGVASVYEGWSEWGVCNAQCGGERERTRKCVGTCAADDGGCVPGTSDVAREECDIGASTVWGEWVDAGSCSKSCNGEMTQRRECSGECGSTCVGGSFEERSVACNVGVETSWGSWSEWSECDSECGTGKRVRSRSCDGTCVGDSGECEVDSVDEEEEACAAGAPDHAWGAWGAYEPCSTDCGTGTQARSRECVDGSGASVWQGEEETACTRGLERSWTPRVPQACSGGERNWTQTCKGCHGACVGSGVLTGACDWGAVLADGEIVIEDAVVRSILMPIVSEQLVVGETSALFLDALSEGVGSAEERDAIGRQVGNVTVVSRKSASSPLWEFSIAVVPGYEEWLYALLGGAEGREFDVSGLFPAGSVTVEGKIVVRPHDLPTTTVPSFTVSDPSASSASSSSSSASVGLVVGCVLSAVVVIAIIVVLVLRQKHRVALEATPSSPFMFANPLCMLMASIVSAPSDMFYQ